MSQGIVDRLSPDPLPAVVPSDTSRSPIDAVARREDLLLKLIAFAATPLFALVCFVKYLPDYAMIKPMPIALSDYAVYWQQMTDVEPFRARFASNYLIYYVAKGIESVIHIPADPRIHPLRLSAAAVTTVCLWLVTVPLLLDRARRWDWRIFYTALLITTFVSLYQFQTGDFPSLVFVSAGLVLLLNKRTWAAMAALLVCGLFRESNIHIAWFAVSMLVIPQLTVGIGWAAAYVVAFFAEWWFIRKVIFHVGGNDIAYVIRVNLTSPTAWTVVALVLCMAGVAYVVVAARRARAADHDPLDTFFMIQIGMVPVWLAFYLLAGSNWTEFRVQLPTLLPLMYALALRPGPVRSITRPAAHPSPA